MPRRRTLSDEQLLAMVLALIHAEGPDAATFAAVAKASGLSGSTLVQRFATKAAMLRAALLYAWDRLDAQTAKLADTLPKTPDGAVALLVGLSQDYGDDAAAYGEGLLVLREDFRDPVLRARGAAWGTALTAAIARCFGSADAPETIARLMLAQWQGSLTWWGFGADGPVAAYVERELRRFLSAVKS
ncbi:TetR family transcriptional regulator [Rhizobium bangladeshense]|uniref:TetR family transcriptional regulator n=1 Tax=Rhizobium bangladeshense TaxID=1138189 RepID=A0ABS7LMA5_9HYPH|nr:TetR family transcriptional regulator [Rhizobium bangladeshense]MBX4869501.1 TetR family transcriptional regulator [Rhizobium bangladeshense]MBX4874897.1 TetR family transcriptional regulator [Rhizobium bangladeshense]MBX4885062.1 TetR family transcriptional regulator [Rhizobium bangladeshense]MBX4891875.1 TetR family transcriptional regulator [Rhizobium bangladeshense]MBX4897256.1 TetR family transcriptional regulator [Rhizobium bangladeshense]